MTKLSTIFDKRLAEIPVVPDLARPHPHTSVGIEIELEGTFPNVRDMKRWRAVQDGSLVGGVEFVSEPVWGTAISDALEEIDIILGNSEPVISFRTSTHIHINCLDITEHQLVKMIHLYILYELPIFRMHEGRTDNIFCVPAYSSVAIQKAYAALFDYVTGNGRGQWALRSKYAALNINSLNTFGTLEFRHMAGCLDMGKVSDWINMLLQLKVAALRDDVDINDPRDVWGSQFKNLDIKQGDLEKGHQMIESINMWRR